MQVEKRQEEKEDQKQLKIDHYFIFKSKHMVFISGPFYKGGFSMSKNKIKAVLELQDGLKKFVEGEYDEKIKNLKDDEILKA